MSQDSALWRWTRQREQAAQLVAEDRLNDEEIAAKVGVDRRTLTRWRTGEPEFRARVDEHVAAYRVLVRRRGIAIVENRVAALQDRWLRMQQVISERAVADEMQDVAGGKTGLLARDVKSIGSGESAEQVDVFRVDAGLLKELREHEKQASQELGQWTDRADLTTDGQPLFKVLGGVDPDEV